MSSLRRLNRRGGIIYPALFLFSIFLLSIFQIKSYDLWWHIKAGEVIAGTGFKPAPTNIFSWTEPDHPWVNFSWLFDVIVYLIHNAAEFNGLILFQAALVGAVFFVVYKTVSFYPENPPQSPFAKGGLSFFPSLEKRGQGRFIIIAALFLIAYFAARFRFSLRPHLLALLFFSVDIYLLNRLSASSYTSNSSPPSPSLTKEGVPKAGKLWVLILIPLLQILWANIHGSAILGVLLPGIFLMGDILNPPQSPFVKGGQKGEFLLIFFLTIIASLINPYGYKVLMDPFMPFFGEGADLFNTLAVDEWQMPPRDMFLGWYGLLLAIGVASFVWRGREYLAPTYIKDILLFSTFALLSVKAVRFIDLFAVAAVPIIYRNFRERETEGSSGVGCAQHRLLFFSILSLFFFTAVKDTTFTIGLGVDNEVIPKKAVEFMEKNRIQGTIFNSYNFGGYLIYKGYPVFMDGRLSYSHGIVREFADANLYPPHPDPLPQGERGVGRGWKMVEDKYRPEIVIIEYDKPAIPETLLRDKQNWALVYWDDLAMLFLRRNEKFLDIIAKNEYRYLNPMNMYGLPVNPPQSPFAKGGLQEIPPLKKGGEGGFDIIFIESQRRINGGPESMRARLLLGNLYLSSGEAEKAAAEYAAVIDSPLAFGKAEAHNNLGTALERMGDAFGAEMEYKAAIRLDRAYPLPQRNLGYLKLGKLRYIEALWNLERYLRLDNGDHKTRSLVYDLKKYRDVLILRIFIGGFAVFGILWIVARRFNAVKREA